MKGVRLLVIDDDPGVLRSLAGLLGDEGFVVESAATAAAGRAVLLGARPPALVLLDLGLPDQGGLELLAQLPRPLAAPVVVLSGGATPGEAVRALQLGATDFVEKPPAPERLLTALRNALELRRLADARAQLEEERARLLEELRRPDQLLGDSPALEELRRSVAKLGPAAASVLLQGETGSGKERVARALHAASGRQGRFVAINCAALPAGLLEAELFGAERGAFTGAGARRVGRFELAHRGTLLLDEIGELPLELQPKLLRVLETREVERLGGTSAIPVDVRVLAATHRDLRADVTAGRFREDLWYRLAVVPLRIAPLRERQGDLAPLLRAFAAEFAAGRALTITPDGEAALRAHRWPGNVRELRNFVERLALLAGPGEDVRIDAAAAGLLAVAAPESRPGPGGGLARIEFGQRSLRELLEEHEHAVLQAALAQCEGNVAAAARLLKVDRGNLWRRLRSLGLAGADGPEEPA